jgi:hypothetical protein
MWSSSQYSWLKRSRVRYPALPDFVSSSGSVTGLLLNEFSTERTGPNSKESLHFLANLPYLLTYSVALSPRANYTDGRPPLVDEIQRQLLWIEGCRVVSAADALRPLISVF